MAGAHSLALTMLGPLYPDLSIRPRLVAVADINGRLAAALADRYGYARVESDWRALVEAPDVDLVVTCLPPVHNVEGRAWRSRRWEARRQRETPGNVSRRCGGVLAACRAAAYSTG
jgi:hypothetical protein